MNKLSIRMYCMGTGDCFILKFSDEAQKFLMMIDCGSCVGTKKDFEPYLKDLVNYVNTENNGTIDLLVVTHEHQDHVNGFHKCRGIFEDKNLKIGEAWFAWTEHPGDPDGRAANLQAKRKKMRKGLAKSIRSFTKNINAMKSNFEGDYSKNRINQSNLTFLDGLRTLADINLDDGALAVSGEPLAGMVAIKEILKKKKVKTKYLNPGETVTMAKAPGLKFYILGPPDSQEAIFKDGKEGKDVYKKYLALDQGAITADVFNAMTDESEIAINDKNLPFESRYMMDQSSRPSTSEKAKDFDELFKRDKEGNLKKISYPQFLKVITQNYSRQKKYKWRKIDYDWLGAAGGLALRLNSHINNTSLAIAIQFEKSGGVIMLPGDAEFGSWQSWHLIKKWEKAGEGKKPLAEDLLKNTVFYKVGHHLSYNGTALEKGISMMPDKGMAAMVTLDRTRISSKWKTTMPNKPLLQDLIKRCDGKVFIMNEQEIANAPSKYLNPRTLKKSVYEVGYTADKKNFLFKQYSLEV